MFGDSECTPVHLARQTDRQMGDIMQTITAGQLADKIGVSKPTMEKRVRRTFPDISPALSAPLSVEQVRVLSAGRVGKKSVRKSAPAPKDVSAKIAHTETTEEKTKQTPKRDYRKIGLISLTVAPFLASVDNMFHVTRELTNPFSAVCLTVLVCVSAVGFTVANSRHRVAIAVTVATVAFEAFCNLTRIYGGLMTGASGNPTKFVGLVTDILGTGTHVTAIFLGAVTALLISGVQYAAIFEMNKPAPKPRKEKIEI